MNLIYIFSHYITLKLQQECYISFKIPIVRNEYLYMYLEADVTQELSCLIDLFLMQDKYLD